MKSKAFGPLLLSLALLGGLSGCVIWDAGYTENKPVSRYVVPPADKFPITYSVSMSAERDDVFALPEVKGLRKKIEDALLATGMFSEVSYGAKGGQVLITSTSRSDSLGCAKTNQWRSGFSPGIRSCLSLRVRS